MDQCFISYQNNPVDLERARELDSRLRAAGLSVFFDKKRLDPGHDWYREIKQHADDCRVVLPVLSPRWKTSTWTKFETYGAEAVIPLVYEGMWGEITTPPLRRWRSPPISLALPRQPVSTTRVQTSAIDKRHRTCALGIQSSELLAVGTGGKRDPLGTTTAAVV